MSTNGIRQLEMDCYIVLVKNSRHWVLGKGMHKNKVKVYIVLMLMKLVQFYWLSSRFYKPLAFPYDNAMSHRG